MVFGATGEDDRIGEPYRRVRITNFTGARCDMSPIARPLLAAACVGLLFWPGCTPPEPQGFDELGTVRMTIKGRDFELWIADNFTERAQGLMHVTHEELAPLTDGTERGMFFAFDHDQILTFWMKDTIIPLDIAYLTSDGEVTAIHTMAPLDVRPGQYPSGSPARYAIEVNANVFVDLGLAAGDRIEIPTEALKASP